MRAAIRKSISAIVPFDDIEKEHKSYAEKWIDSGAELIRSLKPSIPDPHLVVYFLLIDEKRNKLLLVDHKKAGSWLPAGGHVEENELPIETVRREIIEELNIAADFLLEVPFFITVRKTIGTMDPHTDVSLWFALRGSSEGSYAFDREEFEGIKWFSKEEIPYAKADPYLARAIAKLEKLKILELISHGI